MKQKLEESIDRAPPGYFHPKVKEKLPEAKQRFSKIADLNRRSRSVRRAHSGGPTSTKKVFASSLEKLPRLRGAGVGPTQTLPWQQAHRSRRETLAERMKPQIVPVDANPIAVGQYPTFDEIRSVVRGRYPNIPEKAFEAEDINRAFQIGYSGAGCSRRGKRGATS